MADNKKPWLPCHFLFCQDINLLTALIYIGRYQNPLLSVIDGRFVQSIEYLFSSLNLCKLTNNSNFIWEVSSHNSYFVLWILDAHLRQCGMCVALLIGPEILDFVLPLQASSSLFSGTSILSYFIFCSLRQRNCLTIFPIGLCSCSY
jgi:hypothetical protein